MVKVESNKALKNMCNYVQSILIVSVNLQLDRLCAMQCNSHEVFSRQKDVRHVPLFQITWPCIRAVGRFEKPAGATSCIKHNLPPERRLIDLPKTGKAAGAAPCSLPLPCLRRYVYVDYRFHLRFLFRFGHWPRSPLGPSGTSGNRGSFGPRRVCRQRGPRWVIYLSKCYQVLGSTYLVGHLKVENLLTLSFRNLPNFCQS